MDNLNQVPNHGTISNMVNAININFTLVEEMIERLGVSKDQSLGLFSSSTALNTAYPSPHVGDWALVGTTSPFAIYTCATAGTWSDSGGTYSGGSIDLTDYVKQEDVRQDVQIIIPNAAVVSKCYIDTDGLWHNAQYNEYGYIIPVTPLATYKVVANSTYSTCYAFLKDSDHTSNATAHFAGTATAVTWLGYGNTHYITAPTDANFIHIRATVNGYDYLPTYFGLSRSYSEVTTELNNKVTELEQTVAESTPIDLSGLLAVRTGINSSTNKWVDTSAGNDGIFLPVIAGRTYIVTCTAQTQACFLTSDSHTAGETPSYAGGETEYPEWFAENSTNYMTAPADAAYMFIRNTSANVNILPAVYICGAWVAAVANLENRLDTELGGEISILYIGNSLTQDGAAYLPLLLKEIAPKLKFKLYIWYNGGKTLAEQYSYFTNDTACEIFSVCENGTSWTNYNNSVKMSQILANYTFDVVVLQEYMNYQTTYSVTPFNNCLGFINDNYSKPYKVACLLHPPLRSSVASVYDLTIKVNKAILRDTAAEFVIDTGAAVVKAMNTSLDSLGDQSHLSPDGTHTQEGLPCLLQTYVHALWIARMMGKPLGVMNSQLRITQTVYNSINVPGPNLGTGVITGTDAQHEIAQLCAIAADKAGQDLERAAFEDPLVAKKDGLVIDAFVTGTIAVSSSTCKDNTGQVICNANKLYYKVGSTYYDNWPTYSDYCNSSNVPKAGVTYWYNNQQYQYINSALRPLTFFVGTEAQYTALADTNNIAFIIES